MRRIAGRFELLEQLGVATWRAADTELERDVLVRLPAGDVPAARLTHPSIVPVFDQGEDDGEPYAVFEYLPGGTLQQRLDAGTLGTAAAQRIAADVEAALAHAHERGVTHGALGAAAVLLTAEGEAKVAGFGGGGTVESDEHALAELVALLGAQTGSDAESTAVLGPPPPARSRRSVAAAVVAAVVLLIAGAGAAAFLASSGGSGTDTATTAADPASTGTSTQAPSVAPSATTAEQPTTATTMTAPTTTQPTAPPSEPAPTTAPPATSATAPTEPPEPPPTTEPPPAPTEPPPTTEPPPATTAAVTETTG